MGHIRVIASVFDHTAAPFVRGVRTGMELKGHPCANGQANAGLAETALVDECQQCPRVAAVAHAPVV